MRRLRGLGRSWEFYEGFRRSPVGRLGIDIRVRGSAIVSRRSSRGLAAGDIGNDGTLEVLVNNQNEAPSLWKRARRAVGRWLSIRLVGSRWNRSAIGARVTVPVSGRTQTDERRSGGRYRSPHDVRLLIGLGSAAMDAAAGQILTIREEP